MNTMRALLDTNIVYDMLCDRPFDQEAILQLRVMHAFSDIELWVSAKSYTDLFYLMHKEIGSSKAHDLLEDSLTWLHVCSVDETDIKTALEARWQDFEDSLVNVCAEKVDADYLVTRDAKGFSHAKIPHGSVSELMEEVRVRTKVTYAIEELL